MALGTHGSRCCSWGTCRLESHPIDGATRSGFDSLRGPPQTICANASIDRPSAHWGPNDTIVFTFGINVGGNLMRVSANGDTPEQLTKAGSESRRAVSWHGSPQVLPDGAHVLYTAATSDGLRASLLSFATGRVEGPRRAWGGGGSSISLHRAFGLRPVRIFDGGFLRRLGGEDTRRSPTHRRRGSHQPAGATLFRGLRQRLVGLRSRRQTACLRYRFWRRPEHLHLRYRAWHAHPIHF